MTRKSMTEGENKKVLMGELLHERDYRNSFLKQKPWSNTDALYTMAWINLAQEPYIFSVPEADGRYFSLPIIDAWNEEIQTIKKHGNYILIGPKWKGDLPKDLKTIRSPTNKVLIAGRYFWNGTPTDLKKVHALQDKVALKPLSFDEDDKPFALETHSDEDQTYFGIVARALKGNASSQDAVKKLERVGVKEGYIDPKMAKTLENVSVVMNTQPKEKRPGQTGWTHGTHESAFHKQYSKDNIYLLADRDIAHNPLDGKNRYILHFSKERLPDVKGMWSLTAYDEKGNLVENAIDRLSLQGNHVKYNPDGSLDINIQHRFPGGIKEANWLPVPEGPFTLVFRAYFPEKFEKNWTMPGVEKEVF
jgi:DNA sulfur modification protein DndE